ncbi:MULTISPECIES: hypothetical protein [unclassified Wolbachia]|uniref:hypothetical protein n=2 Tax=Wolbachia TaxID=953 RepID=UPI002226AF6E|nr:hypothetical protein [Wolbachia endosymbiont (group A) of Rhinocyllus conicus]
MEKRSARTIKIFTGETMRKKVLTVTCRYEPDELADKRLSDVYGQLIERLIKRKKENREKETNESSEFICESVIVQKIKHSTTNTSFLVVLICTDCEVK